MKYFMVDTHTKVELLEDSVKIESNEWRDLDELLEKVNNHINTNQEAQQLVKESYPKDWEFVMVTEEYGTFLVDGSPQVGESDWTMVYTVTSDKTTVEFKGLR